MDTAITRRTLSCSQPHPLITTSLTARHADAIARRMDADALYGHAGTLWLACCAERRRHESAAASARLNALCPAIIATGHPVATVVAMAAIACLPLGIPLLALLLLIRRRLGV